jgi:hypothetical protein
MMGEKTFSKMIVKWVLVNTILVVDLSLIMWLYKGFAPSEVLSAVGFMFSGTVVAYMGKAGFENYSKYRIRKEDEYDGV